ncbi:prolyl hydroxylase family protein [Alteromonas gracilis]|uniref:prolyl hydroxylase family protein n=1 Tax=Alteromonas gracilis TaxID=1479524 RepID=UPI003736590F
MPPAWKQWVVKCLLSGTDASIIANTLSDNGFTASSIRKVLGNNLSPNYTFSVPSNFYKQLADSVINHNESAVPLAEPSKIQLFTIDNFLSAQECDDVVALTKDKLRPSKLAGAKSADEIRTSTTCELAFLNNNLVKTIDSRIVSTLSLGVGEKEVIQAQHYNVGEYYKPHYDFFPPGSPQYKEHCQTRGQRTWTCMIYLNDECEGGHTRFTKLDIAISPQKGKALFWNNLLPSGEPNLNSIHFAEPVMNGHKTVITKWFRTKN